MPKKKKGLSKEELLAMRAKVLADKKLSTPMVLTPIVVPDLPFPSQDDFVLDPSRFLAAQCSRRAGKTNALARRYWTTMKKYPGSQSIYLALTRDSAEDIMWPVLKELNDKYKWGCSFRDSKLEMVAPNGAVLKLYGADMKNFIKRLKGRKFPAIAIDEAQDFGSHLQSLVDDVLTPAMTDYEDSWLALTGTPGPVPVGYFFDVTHHGKYGFAVHKWTLLENPYLPNPAQFLEQIKKKREWSDTHPTLLREWKNQWVLDVESLWVRYKEKEDDFNELPVGNWHYILGIDVGFRDADALAVLAWSDDSPATYLVEEQITPKQDLTALTEQIEATAKRYNISQMVIDAGGLGKKLAEELRRRKGIPVQDAEKQRKHETVEFLNDALRRGTFRARKNTRFVQDSYLVQIDQDKTTPDRIVIKDNPHSDIIDAVIYAFKLSPAYAYVKAAEPPKQGTREWYEAQENEMFEAELERMQKAAEEDKRMFGGGDYENQ